MEYPALVQLASIAMDDIQRDHAEARTTATVTQAEAAELLAALPSALIYPDPDTPGQQIVSIDSLELVMFCASHGINIFMEMR
jgi:hypothetical protein